jgi:arginase family enzyme
MDGYRPVDPRESPRFSGIKSFMRLPHVKTTEGVDFAIVGVPFDTGASFRVGARFGPEAIRNVSALLRHHNEVLDVSARGQPIPDQLSHSSPSQQAWGGRHIIRISLERTKHNYRVDLQG